MALSITKPPFQTRRSSDGLVEVILDIKLDNSYPANGYPIAPNKIGIKTVFGATVIGYKGATSLVSAMMWSHSTNKLMAQRVVAGQFAEAAAGADLSAITVRVKFMGI